MCVPVASNAWLIFTEGNIIRLLWISSSIINMKSCKTVSYPAGLWYISPSLHLMLYFTDFQVIFCILHSNAQNSLSLSPKWRFIRFHERWLFEGRMLTQLFTNDGCDSSFIQGLTSGRCYRCKMDVNRTRAEVADKIWREFPQYHSINPGLSSKTLRT